MNLSSFSCWIYIWFFLLVLLCPVSEEPRELPALKVKQGNHRPSCALWPLLLFLTLIFINTALGRCVKFTWITALACLQWEDLIWGDGEQSGDPSYRTQTDIHSLLFAFWPELPALEGQILSRVPIVKIAIINSGFFWDNAGKTSDNFQSPNQWQFPAQYQLQTNVSDGEPEAVIFWERSSEEMLIFNVAFLWLDGWVLLMTLSGRSISQSSDVIQLWWGFQMSQDIYGSQGNQKFWKFCLKY